MGIFLGDRARTGQPPPGAFCLSLLHHTTIGIVESVDFVHSPFKMATFLPHMLKIKLHQEFWCFLETFKYYYSLLMYSTRITFVSSNFANL